MVVGVVVPHPPTPGHLRQLRSRGSGRGLRVSAFPLGHDPPVAQQQPHQQLLQPGFVPGERVRTIGPDLPVRPLLGRKEKPGTPLAPSMLQTTALPGKQPPAAAEMNARTRGAVRDVVSSHEGAATEPLPDSAAAVAASAGVRRLVPDEAPSLEVEGCAALKKKTKRRAVAPAAPRGNEQPTS